MRASNKASKAGLSRLGLQRAWISGICDHATITLLRSITCFVMHIDPSELRGLKFSTFVTIMTVSPILSETVIRGCIFN